MKVRDLLAALHDLPVEALDKDIYVENNGDTFGDLFIERITESCDKPEVIGYLLVYKEKQLELDFSKDAK